MLICSWAIVVCLMISIAISIYKGTNFFLYIVFFPSFNNYYIYGGWGMGCRPSARLTMVFHLFRGCFTL